MYSLVTTWILHPKSNEFYIQVFGASLSCNKKRHIEKFVKPKQYEWRMKMSQRPKILHRFGTITFILAIYNLFWFLNENPFRTGQKIWQISWEQFRFCRFRIRENMWWTRYRMRNIILKNTRVAIMKKIVPVLTVRGSGRILQDWENWARPIWVRIWIISEVL